MSVAISHGTDDEGPPPIGGTHHNSNNSIHLDLMTIRSYFGAVVSQLQSRVTVDTIRPLHMFLGVSGHNFCVSPEAFAPPVKKLDKSSLEKFKSRLRLNFSFFLSNYALVAAGVALVIALMHPGMLVSLAFLWGMWMLHSFLISNEVIVFGSNIGTLISLNHRSALLTAITILVVVWKCLLPSISAVAISGTLILSHAIMRDPKHVDTTSTAYTRKDDSDDEGAKSSDSEVLVERPNRVRKEVA